MANEREVKQQICEMGRRMYEKGFVAANDGNRIRIGIGAGCFSALSNRRDLCLAGHRVCAVRTPLLHQHMRVDAAKAECTDRSAPRHGVATGRPGLCLVKDSELTVLTAQIVERLIGVGSRRQLAGLYCQQHLDEAGNTGRSQQMTDVALHRPNHAFCRIAISSG